jgi:hypothetical protein
MAIRTIDDYMASGECSELVIDGTQQFKQVSDGSAAGFFARVNENGVLYGHKVVDQDIVWQHEEHTDVLLTSAEQNVCELTVDADVTAAKGSWAIAGRLDNTERFEANVTITAKVDGAVAKTNTFKIAKNQSGFPLSSWGDFLNDMAAGSVVSIWLSADKDVRLRGDLTPTTLRITEAQAAPVSTFIKTNNDYGTSISRQEIEDAITSANLPRPKNMKPYYIEDANDTVWLCVYLEEVDKFAVKKLNLK